MKNKHYIVGKYLMYNSNDFPTFLVIPRLNHLLMSNSVISMQLIDIGYRYSQSLRNLITQLK